MLTLFLWRLVAAAAEGVVEGDGKRFSKRRVSVNDAGGALDVGGSVDQYGRFVNQFGRHRAEDVYSQNPGLTIAGSDQNFNESLAHAGRDRSAVAAENRSANRERQRVLGAVFLRRLL